MSRRPKNNYYWHHDHGLTMTIMTYRISVLTGMPSSVPNVTPHIPNAKLDAKTLFFPPNKRSERAISNRRKTKIVE